MERKPNCRPLGAAEEMDMDTKLLLAVLWFIFREDLRLVAPETIEALARQYAEACA